MKEIVLKGLDKSCYMETLNNGLDIFMIPYLIQIQLSFLSGNC